MKKMKTGVIGCGNISGIYIKNCSTVYKNIEIVALADQVSEKAEAKAAEYGIKRVCSVQEMLADPEIEAILNLTTPGSHASLNIAAIEAGKHVYVEKPLSLTREEGKIMLEKAAAKDLRVGCAPDTFMGGGIQTCKKLIDDGWIGKPVAATAFMMGHGHESWHPDPEFYYQKGGGPMFDMGPYYLTALVHLMGPVRRVTGSARITFPERTITSEKKYGTKITVEVPTHIAGVLDFESGAIATIVTSFDVWAARVQPIEIYGTAGSLGVPDPNTFKGPVTVKRQGAQEWSDVPLLFGYADNSRGIGLSDMAAAIAEGRKHSASGELAYHVLEIMHGIHDASATGAHYMMKSTVK